MAKNIFKQELSQKTILPEDEVYADIHKVLHDNEKNVAELNTGYHEESEIKAIFSQIIGEKVDDSFTVLPPFYTDFGKHISVGKDVFINRETMFTDLGGITLEDHVLIGPKASLITVNHPIDPLKRRGLEVSPILIKENAWVGAGATILPGVTIGKNAIVAASATVTKDVPDNVIVAGIPAKIIKKID
ncbi:sugar O-acetyltransferase [Dellaglioa sp. L3N]